MDKVAAIRTTTDNAQAPDISARDVPLLSHFDHFDAEEVLKIIHKAPTKHCILDPVPTKIVKQCSDILAPVIASLANQSFDECVFPDRAKHSVVRPLLKKPNLDPFDLASYRPISNLSFVSKLIERLVMVRLNHHNAAHQLLPARQSAYKQHHSTETVIISIVNDILRTLDEGKVCALVLLDMSAAFDTVDHDLLVETLQKRFGLCDDALSWMSSYLTDRTQSVHIGADKSDSIVLRCGVPQGSVLGPVEYISYIEEIDARLNIHSRHFYADDIQFLESANLADVDLIRQTLSRHVISIRDMCSSRRLKLNPDKTELIWFGSRTNTDRLKDISTTINLEHVDITPSNTVRDLGVILDNQLNMKAHISKMVSTGFFHLRRLRQLRRILPRAAKQRLVSALILSRVDYCNAILVGLPASTLSPLKRLMNAAVRFVAGLKPRDHVTPAYKDLHWLPIEQRITFKLCSMMHSIVNGTAPTYISDLVTPISQLSGRSHLRSAAAGDYDVPRTRKRYGQCAFSVAAPSAWNDLPAHIRQLKNVSTFRRQLKGHLFREAYE